MPSNLDRRLLAIESKQASRRSLADHSDAELLALMGWKGQNPPTDEELQAIADGKKEEHHVITD